MGVLVVDVSGEIASKFGVPVGSGGSITRNINGKDVELTRPISASRWTFVISPQGKVVYKDTDVNAAEDSQKVIAFVRQQGMANK